MKPRTHATILIVEDHELMRNALRDSLRDAFRDFDVVTAGSGEEGLAAAAEHRPAAVVMDLDLPGINGIEATRGIKALLPSAFVVMCSLSDDPAERHAAFEAGADEWIPKDQALDELIPAIRRHLAVGVRPGQDRYEGGQYEPLLAGPAPCWTERVA